MRQLTRCLSIDKNERRKTVTGNMCSYPMLFLCSVETYSCTTVDFLKSSAEMIEKRWLGALTLKLRVTIDITK